MTLTLKKLALFNVLASVTTLFGAGMAYRFAGTAPAFAVGAVLALLQVIATLLLVFRRLNQTLESLRSRLQTADDAMIQHVEPCDCDFNLESAPTGSVHTVAAAASKGELLFDEAYYLRINEARWNMAEKLLDSLATVYGDEIRSCADIGCGPGWFSERLVKRGLAVEGFDGRPEIVQEARRRVPGARFSLIDIESDRVAASASKYDVAFCFGLLYHTENPFRVIRNLRALTGKVLLLETIVIPGISPCLWLAEEGHNETQGLTYHAVIPGRTSLVNMLQTAGFDRLYEYTGSVDHEDFKDTDTRTRRRRVFVASLHPLALDHLDRVDPLPTPKYDFRK